MVFVAAGICRRSPRASFGAPPHRRAQFAQFWSEPPARVLARGRAPNCSTVPRSGRRLDRGRIIGRFG
eukprot:1881852-Lingulodinium_polyedra.AAC.1